MFHSGYDIVFSSVDKLKITQTVVVFLAVLVMDMLPGTQASAKATSHNESVLKNVSRFTHLSGHRKERIMLGAPYHDVTVIECKLASAPSWRIRSSLAAKSAFFAKANSGTLAVRYASKACPPNPAFRFACFAFNGNNPIWSILANPGVSLGGTPMNKTVVEFFGCRFSFQNAFDSAFVTGTAMLVKTWKTNCHVFIPAMKNEVDVNGSGFVASITNDFDVTAICFTPIDGSSGNVSTGNVLNTRKASDSVL